jgi:hypothetical protein
MIPTQFNRDGLLPPGEHEATFHQLKNSILVHGPDPSLVQWDASWRKYLVDNLEIVARQLWRAGIRKVFANGSFVEHKPHPNDVDGYFECDFEDYDSGRLENRLNLLDPHKSWTWDPNDRSPCPGYTGSKYPMWHAYRVELYADYGFSLSGITDKYGFSIPIPDLFRRRKSDGKKKGIVLLVPDAV